MNEEGCGTVPFASPMSQHGSSIIYLTNPENELDKMELTFRSIWVDKDGVQHKTGEPLMNDYGISSVKGTVQAIVNQVTILSNLSSNDIIMLMDFLGDTLARDLMTNRKNYNIKSFSARDKIYFTALSSAFITMKRAGEEGLSDKQFWRGSVQEIHSKVDSTGRKGGLLSSLNPWSKQ